MLLLGIAANEWGCGAKPLPRPANTDRENRRRLYPLSAESRPRQTAAPKTKLIERTPVASPPPVPPRAAAPETGATTATPRPATAADRAAMVAAPFHPDLTFQKNKAGEREAVYRLKKGEALYSAVVVRFTGRVDADEVNTIAQKLLEYNGLRDATKIADGALIRIPVRFLDEDILRGKVPPASRPPATRPRAQSRDQFHVILDAGHGGSDPGTIMRGWVEDEIAYDLMIRIKLGLQARGVRVYSTVRDKKTGDQVNGGTTLANNRDEYVKVTPEYYMEDSRVALNLRIYLIEDLYRWMLRRGIAPDNIVLLSIHLDHLHPSLGGAMVYFPGAAERSSQYQASGNIYRYYKESRLGTISFNRRENEAAETASENFAFDMIAHFRQAQIPVHAYKPVRRYVYRHDNKWTPGIIRYSRVPTSILLEAANLSNREDLWRIRSANFRQRLAAAVVKAILAQK
jgi:N-acetylmuramoyl-L-alanine amidase